MYTFVPLGSRSLETLGPQCHDSYVTNHIAFGYSRNVEHNRPKVAGIRPMKEPLVIGSRYALALISAEPSVSYQTRQIKQRISRTAIFSSMFVKIRTNLMSIRASGRFRFLQR